MAERISQDNFDTKILQAEGVAVADFYSDSCVPCNRISPLLADLEEAHDNVYVGKVNIAYDRDLAEKYQVASTPTLIFFKNGAEVKRLHGVVKKAELEEAVAEAAEKLSKKQQLNCKDKSYKNNNS